MRRFLQTVALIAAMMVPAAAGASGLRGDMDDDGSVNINDVTTLINYLLTGNDAPAAADCDMDGIVNISDVATLINYLLSGNWPPAPPQEHEWVNLGLPSRTLWATCNVGANTPEEYGDYFAWGETEPKSWYAWNTYKWCNGSWKTMTKYCGNSDYGYIYFTDDKTELDPEDDAAYVNWGPSWRMPTCDQHRELEEKCTWTWTARNGVFGQLVTGPNGNTIFLPAAGFSCYDSLYYAGSEGFYWSRTLDEYWSYYAYSLEFDSSGEDFNRDGYRTNGHSVRAVRVPEEIPEYVDLGLPSGTLWATCNIGASVPEDYGDYFAWGETEPKDDYWLFTYKWFKSDSSYGYTKYCNYNSLGYDGFTDGKTELDPEDDAAYVNRGSSWRMPSREQGQELVNSCTWTWTTRNGVNGQLGTGPNGNTIFFPAAGCRRHTSLYDAGMEGYYWSRTLNTDYSSNAVYLGLNSSGVSWDYYGFYRYYGYTVRAVRVL